MNSVSKCAICDLEFAAILVWRKDAPGLCEPLSVRQNVLNTAVCCECDEAQPYMSVSSHPNKPCTIFCAWCSVEYFGEIVFVDPRVGRRIGSAWALTDTCPVCYFSPCEFTCGCGDPEWT